MIIKWIKKCYKLEYALSNDVIFMKIGQMYQNFYQRWDLFWALLSLWQALFSEPFYPPELSEGSPRAPAGEAVKQTRNPIYNVSRIMISSLRGQPLRQEPSESLRRERGVPGVSPERKKNKYYSNCNVEIFQAFHYWETLAEKAVK